MVSAARSSFSAARTGWGNAVAASLVGLFTAALFAFHTPGINGTWYWKWRWDPIEPQWFIPPMFGAYLLHLYGQVLYHRYRRPAAALALCMASCFSMQTIGRAMQVVPPSLKPMTYLIRSPLSTSYYDDAQRLLFDHDRPTVRHWLATFPSQLPEMRPHSRFKPPGLVLLFLVMIKLFGATGYHAATAGAFFVAMVAAAGVPATYLLCRRLLHDRDASFAGAAYFALCPSIICFFPQLDQIYPALVCVVLVLWSESLRRRRRFFLASVFFALTMALALFLSYVFLVIGVSLVGILLTHTRSLSSRQLRRAAIVIAISVFTFILAYLILWTATKFNPVATYHAIVHLHGLGVEELHRPKYPVHIPFDMSEFCTGFGWIGIVLTAFCFLRRENDLVFRRRRAIAMIGVAQVLIVAIVGLWPAETARIWMPLMPVLLLPVALELSDWDWRARMLVYSTLWLVTTIMFQNTRFVS